MVTTIQIPNNVEISSPLGALIAHFNASSKTVQKAFATLFEEQTRAQVNNRLMQKISRGEEDIRAGKGISQMKNESNEAFLERLCTM